MEYGKRKVLQSNPAPEPTAFTMRSIHDILAETGDEGLLQPPTPKPVNPPSPGPVVAKKAIEPAPEIHAATDVAKAAADAAARANAVLAANAAAKAAKPQSFGQRLASKVFGRK